MKSLEEITKSMDMSLSKLWEWVMDRENWHDAVHWVQRVEHDRVTELNWTEGYICHTYLVSMYDVQNSEIFIYIFHFYVISNSQENESSNGGAIPSIHFPLFLSKLLENG